MVHTGIIEATAVLCHADPGISTLSSDLTGFLALLAEAVEHGFVSEERARAAVEFARCVATSHLVQVVKMPPAMQSIENRAAAASAAVALAALFPRAASGVMATSKLPPIACLARSAPSDDTAGCARLLGHLGDPLVAATTLPACEKAVTALAGAATPAEYGAFVAELWSTVLCCDGLQQMTRMSVANGSNVSFWEVDEVSFERELVLAGTLADADELFHAMLGSPRLAAEAVAAAVLTYAGAVYAQPEYRMCLADEQAALQIAFASLVSTTPSKAVTAAWEAIQTAVSMEEVITATEAAF
jgi:hypothetical protein